MLTTFDLSLLFFVAFFAFTSLRKGFFHEIAGWIGWITAATTAYFTYPMLVDPLYDYVLAGILADSYISKGATSGKIFTFLVVTIVLGLIISFLLRSSFRHLLPNNATKIFNRIFGSIILGLIKTFILAFLFSSLYDYVVPIFGLDTHPPFLTESFSYFYILQAIDILTEWLPSIANNLVEQQ